MIEPGPERPPAEREEEDTFTEKVRSFLAANARPRDQPSPDQKSLEPAGVAATKAFQAKLFDAGLAGLTYPVEYGGQGLSRRHQEIYTRESAAYMLPTHAITISHGMCLPILNDFGTPEQKARHLRNIIRGDEIWCQMFSEPGAGSDVASLQTKAELDGDEWVVNGQKVWTSGAQFCDFGLCLARTDPNVPKHEGISMFIVDMRAPGVEIRPLRQITGDADFNEIFFTDVRLPRGWLVGDLNRGWNVAVAMLMYERVALGAGGTGPMASRRFDRLADLARRHDRTNDPTVRQALADFYARETILRYVGMRTREALKAGRAPGPEGSIAKVASAQIAVLAADVAARIAGVSTVAWAPDDTDGDQLARGILAAPAIGIAGGTNEVQRNIIGERVLGLPKEPSADKGVPFKELLVGTQTRGPRK
jgi:alkylation response protein AidB-like acyl-CoA dehydrogenase